MKCEQCHGCGRVIVGPAIGMGTGYLPYPMQMSLPCPSCGGTGIASCCEGATGLACDITNEGKEKTGAGKPGRPGGER